MVKRRRAALITRLGGKCIGCGATQNLQFHHPNGRPWIPRRLARHNRIPICERDAAAGNLQLLCISCHSRRTMLEILHQETYLPI
jgi:hypothetical protein